MPWTSSCAKERKEKENNNNNNNKKWSKNNKSPKLCLGDLITQTEKISHMYRNTKLTIHIWIVFFQTVLFLMVF